MKRQIKLLIVLGIILFFPITTYTQTVSFSYDASGNRIQREIIFIEKSEIFHENKQSINNNELADTAAIQHNVIINEVNIIIVPNPNGGKFKVVISGTDENTSASLLLHNLSGTMILKKENMTKITDVDISKQNNGTYFLSIIINDQKETWKVIKQ
jgi:hypothetical protein